MQRFAGKVWDAYKSNGAVQDAAETATGALISAGGQLLLTDMDPGEIATSTAIGAGLALAARPLGARAGYAAGRGLDKVAPGIGNRVAPYIPVTKAGKDSAIVGFQQMGMPPAGIKGMTEMIDAKRNQNAFRPDGTERGNAETILGYYGRTRGDNIAQYGFAAASPLLYGGLADQPEQNALGM